MHIKTASVLGSDNDRSVKTNKSYMRMPKGGNFFLKGTCTFIMVLFCQLKGEREVPETQTSESCEFHTSGKL